MRIGDKVKVKADVSKPKFGCQGEGGWGPVTHRWVGVLKSFDIRGRAVVDYLESFNKRVADFKETLGWIALVTELEKAEAAPLAQCCCAW